MEKVAMGENSEKKFFPEMLMSVLRSLLEMNDKFGCPTICSNTIHYAIYSTMQGTTKPILQLPEPVLR